MGYASGIKAMRLTHTGEDGFNLYVPTEYSLHVYDILMEKGRNFGLINAGYFALRTLRIEKMFAFWGQDLDKNTTPYGRLSFIFILALKPMLMVNSYALMFRMY